MKNVRRLLQRQASDPRPGPTPLQAAIAAGTPGVRRRVDVAPDAKFQSYVEYQALYMDHETGRLLPNTEIWRGDELVMQVNALGCKGPDPEPGAPLIAFFGDSTTMGVGNDSWPSHVHVPGYDVLNAAVEGVEMARMAGWFEELSGRAPIACAVVCAGWHNLVYNETSEGYWEEQLGRFLGKRHVTAYWTIPTCLTPEFRERGVRGLLKTDEGADIDEDYFNFWAELDPDALLLPLIDAIDRYNDFIEDFCKRHDAVLLDLHSLLRPVRYEAATADFFDVCHMRPRAYRRVGEFVGEALGNELPGRGGGADDDAGRGGLRQGGRGPAEEHLPAVVRRLLSGERGTRALFLGLVVPAGVAGRALWRRRLGLGGDPAARSYWRERHDAVRASDLRSQR